MRVRILNNTFLVRVKPSEKQEAYVYRIIDVCGKKKVKEYIRKFYPDFKFKTMSKEQAQKIITGMSHVTNKPIFGVAGRDVPWTRPNLI